MNNIQELKQIIADAPDGAVGINRHNDYTYHAKDMRSLEDIRTIIKDKERIAELEEALQGFVFLHKNKFGLDGAWDVELIVAEKLVGAE